MLILGFLDNFHVGFLVQCIGYGGFGLLILRLISMLGLGFPDNSNLGLRILGLSLEFSVTNNSLVWCKFCVWCITVRV